MKRFLRCFVWVIGFLLFHFQGIAQSNTITGTVVSAADNTPLPGVTVALKGKSRGTVTDADGKFTITAEASDILVFSFIGMETQERLVGNTNVMNVSLNESLKNLEEVVIVGYGVQKKTNLTGAVSTVEKEVLESRPITDVGRGLQGTVPGLTITTPSGQIGQNPTIRLRGMTGTLSNDGGAQPLILVDNVEVPNLQMINPEDIESISVLKDAASASIYGARAAWGVILITTKRGKQGAPTISYSNNFSWSTPTITPKVAPAADGAEATLAALRRRTPGQNAFSVLGMSIDEQAIQRMREWEATYGGQNLGLEMEMGRDFEIRNGGLFFYRSWDPRELFMRKWTPQQKHDLSVSGGNDNTTYYLGVGYLGQEGVLKVNPDEFNRLNLNLSVSTKVTNWLEARSKVLYNNTEFTRPFYYNTETYDPWYYVTRWPAFYPYGTYQGKPFRNSIAEVADAKMNNITEGMTRVSLGTTLKPLKGLRVDIDYTYDNINKHEHQVGGVLSAINFWANPTALRYEPYTAAQYNKVQYNTDWSNRNTGKAFATYELSVSDHAIKLMAGGDIEQYEYWFQMSQRRNVMDPDKGELKLATGDQFVDGARDKWTTLGVFGRINYAYKGKYLLELNGRRDGASRLSPNKKWGFFPSMSVGYVISEENFMTPLQPVLSFLKVRGSYGSIGNQNASLANIYRIMPTATSEWLIGGQNMPTVGTPGALPAKLTWETVSTLDIGLDARFFDDKFGITFDWYRRTTTDMHSPGVTLPNTFGTSPAGTRAHEIVRIPTRNYGEMQTTGWELALDYRHTFGNGINFNVTGMLSDFQEKITKYGNTIKSIDYDLIGRVRQHYEGKVMGDIWGYETDRFFTADDFTVDSNGKLVLKEGIPSQSIFETNGWFFYGPGDIKYRDLNGDGKIDYGSLTEGDRGDLRVIGNSTPRYQYGLRFGADWKGIDLNFFFQGVGKRDFWGNGPVVIPGYRPAEGWFDYQMDYWTPENPNAYYPRPTDQLQSSNAMNFLPQTKYLLNMAYLRMKNISLGYTLPGKLTERVHLKRARLYFSGENLFEFTKLKIPIDPEVDYTRDGLNDTNTFGRVYPYRRTLSFGIQLNL